MRREGSRVVTGTAIAFGLLSALSAISAQAAVLFVNDRTALGANDSVDWAQLGANYTPLANPFTVISGGGLSVTGEFTGGAGERREQPNGWAGNFGSGDALIWSGGPNAPLTLTFANAVSGVGAQIQANIYGNFTGSIEAFDSFNNSLGLLSGLSGFSTAGSDNSAVFWGISSTSNDIKSLVFDMTTPNSDFAINQLSLVTSNNTTDVPEPFTIVGTLVGGTAALRMRKKLKSNDKV